MRDALISIPEARPGLDLLPPPEGFRWVLRGPGGAELPPTPHGQTPADAWDLVVWRFCEAQHSSLQTGGKAVRFPFQRCLREDSPCSAPPQSPCAPSLYKANTHWPDPGPCDRRVQRVARHLYRSRNYVRVGGVHRLLLTGECSHRGPQADLPWGPQWHRLNCGLGSELSAHPTHSHAWTTVAPGGPW